MQSSCQLQDALYVVKRAYMRFSFYQDECAGYIFNNTSLLLEVVNLIRVQNGASSSSKKGTLEYGNRKPWLPVQ